MRPADAIGISGERQKWEDRGDADHLKDGLRKREGKNPGQLCSAVWARQKENATNQIGNVMDKPRHVSDLHVQKLGASHLATANFQIICGKTQVSKFKGRLSVSHPLLRIFFLF
jgi:hypothetical protein